tara:strand:- start:11650 stop:12216 length:567 start_codon:yes stop_codon:yes gene_type:complete
MKYSNNKIKSLYEKDNLQLIKYCEWKDCNNKGIYRAPKNRNNLREFRWFCIDHVREYNKKWNYFLGLSQKEIEKEIKEDNTWHLPTWPMGQRFYANVFKDDSEILKNYENKNNNTYSKSIKSIKDDKILLSFKKLDLPIGASLIEIKKKYKKLVKKHHPDANLNKNSCNNKLIEINEAYKILIDNYSI